MDQVSRCPMVRMHLGHIEVRHITVELKKGAVTYFARAGY